jgi:hypothetical protein
MTNKYVVLSTVPWLRGFIAGVVLRRPKFDPLPVDIWFVMHEVKQMKFWFFPVIVIPLIFYTHLHLQGKLEKPENLQAKQGIVMSGSTGMEGTSVCNIDFFESSKGWERSHAT